MNSEKSVTKLSQLKNLKVAVVQMTSEPDVEQNLRAIAAVLNQIGDHHGSVDLVCFPENCFFMRGCDQDEIPEFEAKSGLWLLAAKWARDLGAFLHFGSVPWREEAGLFNASVVLGPEDSHPRVSYKKIHLFDASLEVERPYRESLLFSPGQGPNVLEVGGWVLGQSICYDLRFPELYLHYRSLQVPAILLPSAFTVPTGLAHWHTLVRARAIETQSYVVAAAQCGEHKSRGHVSRRTFGHSLVVDPWGEVVWDGGEQPNFTVIELNPEIVRRVRQQMPIREHCRLALNH